MLWFQRLELLGYCYTWWHERQLVSVQHLSTQRNELRWHSVASRHRLLSYFLLYCIDLKYSLTSDNTNTALLSDVWAGPQGYKHGH